MSKKEITGRVKINLPAGKATPAPPVGPVVSPLGINIKQFCDDFNNKTKDQAGFTIPAEIIVYKDRSYDLVLKKPLMASLIMKSLSISKGAGDVKNENVGVLTKDKIEEIVDTKMPDLNTVSRESAVKMVKGTARSMGVKVEE
ncbi:MAG TPA: 50S ribosomal protein L11 [Fusobacteria bacterium]|nr:50S ribosomal protein L11 [Fusobacteriota bacterium]|tara:strand:+ start:6119 stop:6547 length:429 start_codon:yes stop_codon:yes gene_type:complete